MEDKMIPENKTIIQLANTFIGKSLDEGKRITGVKLNLMIYLFSREYYKRTGSFPFSEKFRCGKRGPFLKTVNIFYGDDLPALSPIPTVTYEIGENTEDDAEKFSLTQTDSFTLSFYKVWYEYRNMSVSVMEQLLKNPGTAWRKAKDSQSEELSEDDIVDEIWEELNEERKAFERITEKRKHLD